MASERVIEERMGFFVKRGMLDRLPSPWQVKVGWLAMLPTTLSESERERARSRTTWMGQVPIRVALQIVYNPRQIVVDTGLTNPPKQIVKHVMSVYHEDAFLGYDLQLLRSHEGGLALLQREAARVRDDRTRWSGYLKKLTAWPGYHARLVELAADAERDVYPDPLDIDPRFASVVGFAKFCCTMPDWPERGFYGFETERIKPKPAAHSEAGTPSHAASTAQSEAGTTLHAARNAQSEAGTPSHSASTAHSEAGTTLARSAE